MPTPHDTVKTLIRDINRAVHDCKHFKTQANYLLHQCESIQNRTEQLGLEGQRATDLINILAQVRQFVQKLATSGLVLQIFQKSDIKSQFEKFKRDLSAWDHHREMSISVDQALVDVEDQAFDKEKADAVRHQERANKLYKGNRLKSDMLDKLSLDPSKVQRGASLGFFTLGEIFSGTIVDKPVHIKVLRDHLDANQKDAVKRSILINRHLQECDNIAQLKYVAGNNMLIIEATTYVNLHAIPKDVELDNYTKITIARKIAAAVSYVHACGIIHRDIRGANVQINKTENGTYEPKLGGFEACRDDASLSLISANHSVWNAPERARYGTSMSTDIYAFGVLMWEISQRAEPAENSTVADLQGDEHGTISKAYSDLMLRCLSAKTDERPTMKDVAIELANMASSEREV